jgi:glycerate dehydrogenase
MKIAVLDAKTLGDDLDISPLVDIGDLIVYQTTKPEETVERIQGADIVITNKVVIDAAMMDAAPELKLICIAATGTNNIDLEHAASKGITVKNVAGYSTQSVVQHTFAMALYLLEKLAYYDKSVKSGAWSRSGIFTDVSHPFYEIAGKNWGVIGFGTIGQEVARVASAFGAEIYYHSTSGNNLRHGYPHLSLEKLLSSCEIISIHAPLNARTFELINDNNLHLIQKDAILLNLGRGGIINETDLAYELDRQRFYAGLDVLAEEPIDPGNPLMHIKHPERLLITPHIAWTSLEARQQLFEGIMKNIQTFLKEEKV